MKSCFNLTLLRSICLPGLLMFVSSCVYPPSDYLPSVRKVKIRPILSETTIRAHILKYTPLGSSRSNVLEFVRTRLERVSDPYEHGPSSRPVLPGKAEHFDSFFGTRWQGPFEGVGVRSTMVSLGQYGFPPIPMAVNTYVDWAFDKDDRLIDVIVTKDRDSL